MPITYRDDAELSAAAFTDILDRSGLAERRPVGEPDRIAGMVDHANLTVTAWDGERLIGVSRCVTDFTFCCYCSDLAVDRAYQKQGIGRRLLMETKVRVHPKARCFLISAPAMVDYYRHIGLDWIDRAYDFTELPA